jgi:hypothetical protein
MGGGGRAHLDALGIGTPRMVRRVKSRAAGARVWARNLLVAHARSDDFAARVDDLWGGRHPRWRLRVWRPYPDFAAEAR